MSKEEPIITFRTYYDPMLAHIEQLRLQDSGIQCFLADENLATINPLYNNALGGIKLKVFECDVEKCKAILAQDGSGAIASADNAPVEEVADAVVCPYCGSDNVRYGDATQKRYGWFTMIISFLLMVMPFTSRKAWHCFNCGKDFE